MTKLEEALARRLINETRAIEDHKQDGQLHQYIDDNKDDLLNLLQSLKYYIAGGQAHERTRSA